MSTNDSPTVAQIEAVIAHFHNREDAERAVIELRDEGFPADAIDAVFVEPTTPLESLDDVPQIPPNHPIPTEAGAPGNTASNAAEAVLPDAPVTTMTGGSPFGEASTYVPDERKGKPYPGDSTVTVRTTSQQAAEAKSILERNNGILPTQTSYQR